MGGPFHGEEGSTSCLITRRKEENTGANVVRSVVWGWEDGDFAK